MAVHFTTIAPLVLIAALAACGQKPEPVTPPATPAVAAGDRATEASSSGVLQVTNFSPDRTPAGTPFNVQADGNSGISFELDRAAPPAEFSVWFDGKPLPGVVSRGRVVTATIPVDYLSTPGRYPLVLEVGGRRLPAGEFVVEAP
ncbi:MAG: hypothetical protein ACR2J7_00745 [Luteimonas sp.]